uniref:Uncharacterized protein n=1 Tax=Arundo donax TaxID=35708 RepID=A0A0A9CA29_ARUDO
MEETDKAHF